jgi:hypothetical protein
MGVRIVLAMAVVVTTACGSETSVPPARLAVPPSEVVASFGRLQDESGVEELSRAGHATLSGSGRYLAIRDNAPPFIKVLDRVEQAAWSFGRKGEGPGELGSSSTAVAFLGDSMLLVHSGQRLERYNVRGEWLDGTRLPADVLTMSLTTGCDGRIFLYGVPTDYRQLDPVPWLHEFDPTSGNVNPILAIPGRAAGSVRWGALFGVNGTAEGVLVWHIHIPSHTEVGYWVPCDGSPPSVLDKNFSGKTVEEAFFAGSERVTVLSLPDTLFAGAAAQGSTAVRAFRWQEGDTVITSLRIIDRNRCGLLELPGDWRLHDLHLDLAILSRSDPYPVVRVVKWSWIESNLTEVPCTG